MCPALFTTTTPINRLCPLSGFLVFKSVMDEDLPFPVTVYIPGGQITNALKTLFPTLYIYPKPIDIHATHVNYMFKYP
jgi:hypothetical protein